MPRSTINGPQDGAITFNEGSADVDFRVESNGDANMLFVDAGNDRIYMGRNASDGVANNRLQIEAQDGEAGVSIHRGSASSGGGGIFFSKSRAATAGDDTVVQSGDEIGKLFFAGADGTDRETPAASISVEVDGTPGSNDMPGRILFATTADGASSVTERMRIDSTGNLLIGHTSQDVPVDDGGAGVTLRPSGVMLIGGTGTTVFANREDSDGEVMQLRRDGAGKGIIGVNNSDPYICRVSGNGMRWFSGGVHPCDANGNTADNVVSLGTASSGRFDDAFITNGVTTGSDQNEKQNIETLTAKELNIANKLSALFKTYRWKDAVVEKGDKARTHSGIIAQDIQSVFSAEGLDASNYGMFMSDTWWEKEISVDAVKADKEKYIEAKDAYTYTDIKHEKTDGYTEKTRLGVRYPELFSFIFSSIDARLTALESK